MTRRRYAVVVIAGVLFTLALGIGLGGGVLQKDVAQALDGSEPSAEGGVSAADIAELRKSAGYDAEFASGLADSLLHDRLSGRSVLLLVLPGADPSVVEAITADLQAAGARLTTSLQIGEELVDPSARILVETLTKQLAKEDVPDVEIPKNMPAYEQVGMVLSRALLSNDNGGTPLDDAARSVFNSYATAKLISGNEPRLRADSALVIAPEGGARSETAAERGTIVADMLTRMRAASNGVVLAGPPSSGTGGGLVALARGDAEAAKSFATIDTVQQRSGQIVSVLLLSRQQDGEAPGHFGVSDTAERSLPSWFPLAD